MNRSLILLCLVGVFCVATNAKQVIGDNDPWASIGRRECRPGMVWSDCSGLCRRTCNSPQPVQCLERICFPGCICPEGQVMNRMDKCVDTYRCRER